MRSGDMNKLRKLRFAQATLLGVKFERYNGVVLEWSYLLPGDVYGMERYIWRGFRRTRHEAVLEALISLGLELKEPDYRDGNKRF